MVELARKAMPKEQLEKFERIGKELYESIDYETGTVNGQTLPKNMAESVAYVLEGVKSGLHPSDLTIEEKFLLKEICGEKWYEKYGYIEEDLSEMHTLGMQHKHNE